MKKILCLIIVMMSVTLFSFTAESAVNPDTQYNGHGYKIFNDGMTWQQAKTYCENLGGHLVTITSSQEQAVVVNLLRSKGNKNSYWLGGYYGNDRNWHWVTNEPFSYTNWGGGQPDYAFGRENCLMIYKSTANGWPLGDWNDLAENGRCDPDMINFFGVEHFGFICEWDSIPKTVTIPDGWYRIQPMHDLGRSADALGSQIKMGNNIYMWTNNSALQQKFYLQNRGDGYFSLQSAYGNKLYVTADGRDKGANLYTSPWMNNSAFQLFKLVDAGNNSYHIFAKVGDNLDFDCYGGYSSDGNNIQLWTSEDNPWHKWRFTKVILGNHPEGEVQVIESTSSNTLHVRGTAFDLDNPSSSTRLHVYVGGTPGSSVPQYEIRTDGNSRIFDDTREIDSNYSGRQNVHIYALNDYGEGDTVEIWNGFVDIKSETNVPDKNLQNLISTFTGQKWDNRESNTLGKTCFGFANYIFRELHGVIAGSNIDWSNAYTIKNLGSGVWCRFSGYVDENTLHTLFQQCKPGDFIQATRNNGTGQHSMIFVSYDVNSRKVRLFDANFTTAQDNLIQDRNSTVQKFFTRFQIVSVYTK